MANIIKAKPNKDGKVIVTLYGKEFDVTKKDTLKAFGVTYEIQHKQVKANKAPVKKVKKINVEGSSTLEYLESPEEN